MCVIITSPGRDLRPTRRQLQLCEKANAHGSGIAFLEGKRVRYEKNLTVQQIHQQLASVEGPAIVHFRIASVGGVNAHLCHPFPITHNAELHQHGRARSVLFHNGTWSEWSRFRDHFSLRFPKREPVSDTRVAATMVARFGFEWLQRFDYCRWTTLNAEGVQRIGNWHDIDGCHYSNTHWQPRTQDNFADGDDCCLF